MEQKEVELPSSFLDEMRQLLGEELPDYLHSFSYPCARGLRINTGKVSAEWFHRLQNFPLEPIPWISNGFYYDSSWAAAKDPYHYAGLYYLQEPSAMTPANLLPVRPGDKVLDLCAAPGGKSTELGARLKGQGLLFANDISNSRAKALLKNLERFGIPNFCVASENPERLSQELPEFFDQILVDAPCSGEGMFRKEPDMVKEWAGRGPEFYAPIQRDILHHAVRMLKPGGNLLYSTCTFSRLEDEENVVHLLESCPEMELAPLPLFPGAADGIGLSGIIRLYPHRIKGEGHFLALLHKKGRENQQKEDDDWQKGENNWQENREKQKKETGQENQEIGKKNQKKSQEDRKKSREDGKKGKNERKKRAESQKTEANGRGFQDFLDFQKQNAPFFAPDRLRFFQNRLYCLPEYFPEQARLRYLRTGLFLGEEKGGRFEPSQALAQALTPEQFPSVLRLSHEDERVLRYLKGETLALAESEKGRGGWRLVCVDDFPLGWAKEMALTLKNKYYPGWRYQ